MLRSGSMTGAQVLFKDVGDREQRFRELSQILNAAKSILLLHQADLDQIQENVPKSIEQRKKDQSTYLSNQNCIGPPILDRHILGSAIHHFDARQIPLLQHSPHVAVRFNSNNLKPFLTSCQCFGEDPRPCAQVDDPGTFLAGDTALFEDVLDRVGWVGGSVGVVGGGVCEAGLGDGVEGGHFGGGVGSGFKN